MAGEIGGMVCILGVDIVCAPIVSARHEWLLQRKAGTIGNERQVLVCEIIRKCFVIESNGFRSKEDDEEELRQVGRGEV